MKSIVLFIALIALISAQHPVPIPGVSLSVFNGQWFVAWSFNSQDNTNNTNPVNCIVADISTTSNGGTINEFVTLNSGQSINQSSNFTIGNMTTVWNFGNENQVAEFNIIAIDPVAQSWAVLAAVGEQTASILSRTTQVSNLIISAQITLLVGEGYAVNTTNVVVFPGTQCETLAF